jgi:multiple sugar transport system substrate-binding protein
MHDRARDLAEAFARGALGRRELFRRMGRLGVGAAAAGYLMNEASTRAMAQSFDWKANSGKTVRLLLNKHPYADAMIANLANFKDLTGMDVTYDVFPEDVYFDKVGAALSSGSDQYDAFMTGASQTWQYGPAGWIVDLNEYIQDAGKTSPQYNWEDVLPNLRASTSWSGEPFAPLGGDGAKQWAIPWGFELNSIAYNKRLFGELGVEPAKNLPELVELAKKITAANKGYYGIGVRGSRSWATIHPGYLSAFANYGAQDFAVEGGKGKAAMNSAAGKEMTALWVRMIQESGPRNWATYTWYNVGTDLGAGASAMIYDADILGYFMNGGDNKEKGNIAYTAFAPKPGGGAHAQRLDLVARDERVRPRQGRRLGVHAVGVRHRARPVRRAADGLRQPGARVRLEGRGVPQAHRRILPRLPRAVRRERPRLQDLLHAATLVRGGDDAVGGGAATDGGEGGPGRRGLGPARREHRRAAPAGRAGLSRRGRPPTAGAPSSTRARAAAPWRPAPPRQRAWRGHPPPGGGGPVGSAAPPCPTSCRCRRSWCASASWSRSARRSGTRSSATT